MSLKGFYIIVTLCYELKKGHFPLLGNVLNQFYSLAVLITRNGLVSGMSHKNSEILVQFRTCRDTIIHHQKIQTFFSILLMNC